MLAILGVLLLAAGFLLGALALPSGASTAEDPAAGRAVRALVSGDVDRARAAVPAGFVRAMGYRPVRRDGMLVRPDGSCSSPLPMPDRFDTFCARHDLGYDLLRYAAVTGRPLGPWARVALDESLARGMRGSCDDFTAGGCRVAAETAYLGVRANSVRQGDLVPGAETAASVGAVALGGGGALAVLALPFPALARRRVRMRIRAAAWVRRLPATPVVLVAGLAASASLVPAVLARPAWLQGVFTGLLVAGTYSLGRVLARWARGRRLDTVGVRVAALVVSVAAMVLSATGWSASGTSVLDPARAPGPLGGWLFVLVVAAAVVTVLLLAGALVVACGRRVMRRVARGRAGTRASGVTGVAVAAGRQRLYAGALVAIGLLLAAGDPVSGAARAALTSEVGGRFFEAVGLDTAADNVLSRPSPRGAVRVYVGVHEAGAPAARSRLAVARLERAGGFERQNLVLAFPTGSGWVDPVGVRAVERRFDGDVATAAVQSTFLPSWAALMVARQDNEDGARALVAAVTERLAEIPEADRPRLYLIGQSLGVLAATAVPVHSAGAEMVCGATWTGPPGGEVPRLPGPVVLANADDPVVSWEPSLAWHRPASYPGEVWIPGLSYLATGIDTIASLGAPTGHGHRYGPEQGLLLPECP